MGRQTQDAARRQFQRRLSSVLRRGRGCGRVSSKHNTLQQQCCLPACLPGSQPLQQWHQDQNQASRPRPGPRPGPEHDQEAKERNQNAPGTSTGSGTGTGTDNNNNRRRSNSIFIVGNFVTRNERSQRQMALTRGGQRRGKVRRVSASRACYTEQNK